MASFTSFLAVYVLGGVTFIPLVLISVLLAGFYTFPYRDDLGDNPEKFDQDGLHQPGDDMTALEAVLGSDKRGKERARSHQDADEAAGYFAVCREYTPLGINAKPIERTTPAGSATVASPSQSIYQTMYRGIFERRQAPGPTDNSNNSNSPMSQRPKKAGNVYYVILRHGHLMLFDDEDQTEVRYVISLLLHDISLYSGGDEIPEGELFIKRNAICLSRKRDGRPEPDANLSKPFYLFSENCSAKEDFYFSLLRNQEQVLGAKTKSPRPLQFDTKHIIDLVQRLYAVEDNAETRWLNAVVGRIFLGVYQTTDVQDFIREKITKKISRIKRPSFLTHIVVRRIDFGESAPFITNPRLKDLTVQGECVTEADVRYTGSFRIEIGTTAKVDIGHFTREVTLVLAVVLKKVEGHALFKIKPPPSNRLWVAFTSMPKLEMTIEPIVSSRQITWNIVLNQIESRIREVFAESMVLPFWDDTPFFRTEHKKWRGGIWADDEAVRAPSSPETAVAQGGNVDEVERFEQGGDGASGPPKRETNGGKDATGTEKSDSNSSSILSNPESTATPTPTPPIAPSPSPSLFSRRLAGNAFLSPKSTATASGSDPKNPGSTASRAPRTGSFSSALMPIVGTDNAHSDVFKASTPPDAVNVASRIASLSGKMQQMHEPPASTPYGSPARPSSLSKPSSIQSVTSSKDADTEGTTHPGPPRSDTTLTSSTTNTTASSTDSGITPISPVSSKFSLRSHPTALPLARGFFSRKDESQSSLNSSGTATLSATAGETKRGTTLAAVSNAALQARQWGLSALKRNENKGVEGEAPHIDLSQPMGRGQPLPPPGVPLPMPDKKTPTAPIRPGKRNLAPPPLLTGREHGDIGDYHHHHQDNGAGDNPDFNGSPNLTQHPEGSTPSRQGSSSSDKNKIPRRPIPAPPLPKRRLASSSNAEAMQEAVLVVAAPESSEPTTPQSPSHPVAIVEMGDDTMPVPPSASGLGIAVDTLRSVPDLPSRRYAPTSHPREFPLPEPATKQRQEESISPRFNSKIEDDDDDLSGWMGEQEFEGLDVDMACSPGQTNHNSSESSHGSADLDVSSHENASGVSLGAARKAHATTTARV
ncbi:PH domain-containing protein [Zalerion maritima]|uniref:PH domain-containing protein n=1 Tax=Zalerion maritima TaxID=339359 RepID=A0AAD5RSR1_9PEZI|nr:PH domain-containing protein [Zalerion maritima]